LGEKKWSSGNNAKDREIYVKHWGINTKHLDIYANIKRFIQTSGDLLVLLLGDLYMFCLEFLE